MWGVSLVFCVSEHPGNSVRSRGFVCGILHFDVTLESSAITPQRSGRRTSATCSSQEKARTKTKNENESLSVSRKAIDIPWLRIPQHTLTQEKWNSVRKLYFWNCADGSQIWFWTWGHWSIVRSGFREVVPLGVEKRWSAKTQIAFLPAEQFPEIPWMPMVYYLHVYLVIHIIARKPYIIITVKDKS